MTLRRVVVTGMGALTPIGNDLNSYWNGLISGSSGCADITHFDASEFKTKFACELKGFDPLPEIKMTICFFINSDSVSIYLKKTFCFNK